MKCSELMNRDVLIARNDDSVQYVAWEMLHRGMTVATVIDDERHFKGALSDRSLVAQVVAVNRESASLHAGDVSHALPTVGPDDEHTVAEQKMREAKTQRAAVVDGDGHFLGLITLGALADKAGSAEAANQLKSIYHQ